MTRPTKGLFRSAARRRPEAERAVQPADEGEQPGELVLEQRGQPRARHLLVAYGFARYEGLVLEPPRRGVRLGKAAWHPLEHGLVIKSAKAPHEPRLRHDPLEPRWVLGDGVARTLFRSGRGGIQIPAPVKELPGCR